MSTDNAGKTLLAVVLVTPAFLFAAGTFLVAGIEYILKLYNGE